MGMLLGGMLAGTAADRVGRRSCLIVSLAVNCTFAAVSAAAPSVGWLIAARVCAGLGKSRQNVAQLEQPLTVHRPGSSYAFFFWVHTLLLSVFWVLF